MRLGALEVAGITMLLGTGALMLAAAATEVVTKRVYRVTTLQLSDTDWAFSIHLMPMKSEPKQFVHSQSGFSTEKEAKAAGQYYIDVNLAGGDTPLPEKP